jgi:hypothetical protein
MTAMCRFGGHSALLLARLTVVFILVGIATTVAWAEDPDVAAQVRARRAEVEPLCPGLLALKTPLSPQQTYQKTLCLLYRIKAPEQTPATPKVPEVSTQVNDADPFSDPLANSDSLPPGYHCHFYGLGKKVCHGSGMD